MHTQKPILLVEDDRVDALTVKRALKELKVSNPLHIAGNGEEALAYLRDPSHIEPFIILLDINMPRMNGLEFLDIIKLDERLKKIPVVVLTTSRDDQDKFTSFNLNVAGYMIKPVDYIQFLETVRTIKLYWTLSEHPFRSSEQWQAHTDDVKG